MRMRSATKASILPREVGELPTVVAYRPRLVFSACRVSVVQAQARLRDVLPCIPATDDKLGPSIKRRTKRRSRFSKEQIISVLKEHEPGMETTDVCHKHGISDASLYKWTAKYGSTTASETARLRTLEEGEPTAENQNPAGPNL